MNDLSFPPLKVFLCHASEDKNVVRLLANELLKTGVDVWFDETSLLGGQKWERECTKAVISSDVTIICLSEKSTKKTGYVQKEVKIALDAADLRPEGTISIIPVKLDECKIPDRLLHIQSIQLRFNNGTFKNEDFVNLLRSLSAAAVDVNAVIPSINWLTNPQKKINRTSAIINPLLVVISGPSGVGKDAVVKELKQRDLGYCFPVNSTTRPPRPGESQGSPYLFLSKDEFVRKIRNNEFVEFASVYGEYKGIPRASIDESLKKGKDVIIRVDTQGAITLRNHYPEAILIFLCVENKQILLQRIKQRGSFTPESMKLRIFVIQKELETVNIFDYFVVNEEGCLENTVDNVVSIIQAEHMRINSRNENLIQRSKNQFSFPNND